jgi:hypothetical protein
MNVTVAEGVDGDLTLTSVYDAICSVSPLNRSMDNLGISWTYDEENFLNSEETPLYNEYEEDVSFHNPGSVSIGTGPNHIGVANIIVNTVGSGSNLVAILVIMFTKRLRKPFYMCVLSLCTSDIFYFVNLLVFENLSTSGLCSHLKQGMIMNCSLYSVKMFSKLNVVLLASVRYVMFVYPLKSRVHLTNRLILALSLTAMVLSIAYGMFMGRVIWVIPYSRIRILSIIDDAILVLIVVILNCAFLVRRLRVAKTSQAARDLKLRMTVVVIIILILHILSSCQTTVYNILQYDDSSIDAILDLNNAVIFGFILIKVVHFIDPFIFFFSSPMVIKSITSLFSKCKLTK